MNYPIWEIPGIGGPWLIGIISILHIFVSHFAVGGGAFFALTEQLAYQRNSQPLYDYLKKHSKFFVLLTTVWGAVSGVGIWWAISLVSPDATHTLIQTYTLGWAEEYLFFVAELATIFVYYYTWDKISKEQHLKLAQLYFVMSVLTLVIINGILTFMLTPGDWLTTKNWLHGFFNETYLPSLLIRLLIMFAVAGMYALMTASQIKDLDIRTQVLRYASKWFLPVFILGPIFAFWYFYNLPNPVLNTIMEGLSTTGMGNFSILARVVYLCLILSGTILLFAFVGPYLNPKGFSPHTAFLFLLCGLMVTGSGEYMRELMRKPYSIYNYMYSNGILKTEVANLNKSGYMAHAKWIKDKDNAWVVGETMYKNQCMSCHTAGGYRSLKKLLDGRDEESILSFLNTLRDTDPNKNPYTAIMPPVVGKNHEVKALAHYLAHLNGMVGKETADAHNKPIEKEPVREAAALPPAMAP